MIKKIFLILTALLSITSLAQDNKIDKVNKMIEIVKQQYAPDKRVAVFQVKAGNIDGLITLTGETNLAEAKEKLLAAVKSAGLKTNNEIKLLPAEELQGKIYGLVNLSVANNRTKPNHAEELSTQTLLGTPVKILKKAHGNYLVQTPDLYISWVDDDGITPLTKAKFDEWLHAEKIIYQKEFGFTYSKPDVTSLRVSDLVAGNILVKIADEGNFTKIKYPDGRTAFVEKAFCMNYKDWLERKMPTGADIISTAEKFMGVPYLWGGTSSKGMDCSGFTKTVYFLNGIVLARDASQQVLNGVLVDTHNGFDNLQTGDLLFFGTHATDSTKERITHVAIYYGNY
ncbi:MAG: C40 family peptidase, partial [Bacteroidota bacterium]